MAARLRAPARFDRLVARWAVGAIRLYQKGLSRRTGATCLFAPSCSQRALGWLEAHGFNEGMRLTAAQLGRCGGSYALSITAQGETWLVTHDKLWFGPSELSPAVRGQRLARQPDRGP